MAPRLQAGARSTFLLAGGLSVAVAAVLAVAVRRAQAGDVPVVNDSAEAVPTH